MFRLDPNLEVGRRTQRQGTIRAFNRQTESVRCGQRDLSRLLALLQVTALDTARSKTRRAHQQCFAGLRQNQVRQARGIGFGRTRAERFAEPVGRHTRDACARDATTGRVGDLHPSRRQGLQLQLAQIPRFGQARKTETRLAATRCVNAHFQVFELRGIAQQLEAAGLVEFHPQHAFGQAQRQDCPAQALGRLALARQDLPANPRDLNQADAEFARAGFYAQASVRQIVHARIVDPESRVATAQIAAPARRQSGIAKLAALTNRDQEALEAGVALIDLAKQCKLGAAFAVQRFVTDQSQEQAAPGVGQLAADHPGNLLALGQHPAIFAKRPLVGPQLGRVIDRAQLQHAGPESLIIGQDATRIGAARTHRGAFAVQAQSRTFDRPVVLVDDVQPECTGCDGATSCTWVSPRFGQAGKLRIAFNLIRLDLVDLDPRKRICRRGPRCIPKIHAHRGGGDDSARSQARTEPGAPRGDRHNPWSW